MEVVTITSDELKLMASPSFKFVIETATGLVWATEAQSAFNCMVKFEGLQPLPYTATAVDAVPHGAELFKRGAAGEFGSIAPYVAPVPGH